MKILKYISKAAFALAIGLFIAVGLIYLINEGLDRIWTFVFYTASGLFLFSFIVNLADITVWLRKRPVLESMALFLMVPILFGMLSMVYLIADGHKKRFDFTVSKKYSLSEETVKVLEKLDMDINILCFIKNTDSMRPILETALDGYRYKSPHIKYRFIDPDRHPQIAKEYGVDDYGEVVVESEKGKEKIKNLKGEEELTNAILKIVASEKKTIYFIVGHGEPEISDMSREGLGLIKKHLEMENYELKPLHLIRVNKIPDDASVVILMPGKTDYFEEELKLLKDYYYNGHGSLLIMGDKDIPITMREFLLSLGVVIGKNVVIDKMSQLFGASYDTAIITKYGTHPISENFNVASFFPEASSVKVTDGLPDEFKYTYLAYTAPNSWAETDLEALKAGKAAFDEKSDLAGPVSVAVVIEEKADNGEVAKKSKLVIIGDSDFIKNAFMKLSGNKDFFLNIAAWLSGEEKLISIHPKKVDATPLFLRKSQSMLLFVFPALLLPAVVLGIGIFVAVKKRNS